MPKPNIIVVGGRSRRSSRGLLRIESQVLACALGRSGRLARKCEGDGATPIGVWTPIEVLYRADRIHHPRTQLPVRALRPRDGWCDDVRDRCYNRAVKQPYPARAERLWRADAVYDMIVVLDHNRCPRVRGGGSAIFIHVARPDYAPTEGCIALDASSLRRLVGVLSSNSRIVVA